MVIQRRAAESLPRAGFPLAVHGESNILRIKLASFNGTCIVAISLGVGLMDLDNSAWDHVVLYMYGFLLHYQKHLDSRWPAQLILQELLLLLMICHYGQILNVENISSSIVSMSWHSPTGSQFVPLGLEQKLFGGRYPAIP